MDARRLHYRRQLHRAGVAETRRCVRGRGHSRSQSETPARALRQRRTPTRRLADADSHGHPLKRKRMNLDQMISLTQELINAYGPCGQEAEVRTIVLREMKN